MNGAPRGRIITYQGITPDIDLEAFIAPGAHVIGKVDIGAKASIWYNCVVRGDEEPIHIGAGSNIQDGTTIHTAGGIADTWIGSRARHAPCSGLQPLPDRRLPGPLAGPGYYRLGDR